MKWFINAMMVLSLFLTLQVDNAHARKKGFFGKIKQGIENRKLARKARKEARKNGKVGKRGLRGIKGMREAAQQRAAQQ
jgi:hypothetical protein